MTGPDHHGSDRAEIESVLIRYATGLDRRDFDLVRSCFHDDVRAEYSGVALDPGVSAVIAHVRIIGNYVSSLHFIGNVEIQISAGAATSSCRAVAYLVDDRAAEPRLYMRSLTYRDRLLDTDAGWRIIERVHSVDWSVELPVTVLTAVPRISNQ